MVLVVALNRDMPLFYRFTTSCVTDSHGQCYAPLDAETKKAVKEPDAHISTACAEEFDMPWRYPARECVLRGTSIQVLGRPGERYHVILDETLEPEHDPWTPSPPPPPVEPRTPYPMQTIPPMPPPAPAQTPATQGGTKT